MFFANLGLVEFLTLFAAAGGITFALYLLSRARRRYAVSTLRFWVPAAVASQQQRKRKIDQPWSLLLQLLSLLALLLAISQPKLGNRENGARDHVLLLDTTALMGARSGQTILLEDARRQSLEWLRSLPTQDRVMLVRVDTLPTPATQFEEDRRVLSDGIRKSSAGSGALNLNAAIEFAQNAQRLSGRRIGEIVYAGAARISGRADAEPTQVPQNLRWLPVEKSVRNAGLTRVSLQRSSADPDVWEAVVNMRNYGVRPTRLPLIAGMGGAPVFTRTLDLAGGSESSTTFTFRSRAAGWFEARLNTVDDLETDNRITLDLPEQRQVRVAVYSAEPNLMRALFSADPRIQASYFPPSAYAADADVDLMILDRIGVPDLPRRNAIWIAPPASGSPIPVRTESGPVSIESWSTAHILGTGLRTKDLKLPGTLVMEPSPGDIAIASVRGGAVIVARAGANPADPKTAVIGFHPLRSNLRFELITPLLFANLMHWMVPDSFRRWNLNASPVGTVAAALVPGSDPASVRVSSDQSSPLPFTVEDSEVRFFTAVPSTVRVASANAEQVFALTLPQVAERTWIVPASVPRGVSGIGGGLPLPKETWRWLAILGLAGLLVDWYLFGRTRVHRALVGKPNPVSSKLRRAS